jgi:threonine aldolase
VVHADDAPYYVARTGLVTLENSHNFAGGAVMTRARTEEICDGAHALGLPVHLDGARIFNAAAALGEPVAALARPADSVMFCLSKGLGAPVGSMLLGARDLIAEARRWRKLLGGGMRQAGVLAAAGLVALEETPPRLHEDHANARRLAEGLAQIDGITIDPGDVETNIVVFEVADAKAFCAALADEGVGMGAVDARRVRAVTHLDVDASGIERALTAAARVL